MNDASLYRKALVEWCGEAYVQGLEAQWASQTGKTTAPPPAFCPVHDHGGTITLATPTLETSTGTPGRAVTIRCNGASRGCGEEK